MDAATTCAGYAFTGMPVAYTPAAGRDEPLVKECSANGSNDSSSDLGLDIGREEMRESFDWFFVRKLENQVHASGGGGGMERRPKCGGSVFM